jgi:hypothetical protein
MANIDGGDIHYERDGTGHPMIMLLPQSNGPVGTEPVKARLYHRRTR